MMLSENALDGVKETRNDAWNMLLHRDFEERFSHKVKFKLILDYFFVMEDETAGAYIKKSLAKIMKQLIPENDVGRLQKLLEKTDFITKKNIDKFIALAIEHTQNGGSPEIQTMLMHHKAEVLGYSDPEAQFKL